MADEYKYEKRGVSATKDEVHAAIKNLDKGLYPRSFCKVIPDVAAGDPNYCNIMHADTAGTKTSLAYLYWKETGDLSVWKGIAEDAMVMNLDDMACVGCVTDIMLSSTIGRNKNLIPGEVLSALIQASSDFIDRMRDYGVHIHPTGGETADVGDIVRTIDVGYTTFARMPRARVIENNIQAGDVIVGLASFGQAHYENQYNGGMGSNGLTSARHDVLHKAYAKKYPESFDPNTADDVVYIGSKKLTDTISVAGLDLTVGKLLLSPTRTYLPYLKRLLEELHDKISGIIHNTGGGQTKVLKFIEQKRVIKDELFPLPRLFELIQQEAGTPWKEMYQVFNMGHRLEVYLPETAAPRAIEMARELGIDAQVIGRVEEYPKNRVSIESPYGSFEYE